MLLYVSSVDPICLLILLRFFYIVSLLVVHFILLNALSSLRQKVFSNFFTTTKSRPVQRCAFPIVKLIDRNSVAIINERFHFVSLAGQVQNTQPRFRPDIVIRTIIIKILQNLNFSSKGCKMQGSELLKVPRVDPLF